MSDATAEELVAKQEAEKERRKDATNRMEALDAEFERIAGWRETVRTLHETRTFRTRIPGEGTLPLKKLETQRKQLLKRLEAREVEIRETMVPSDLERYDRFCDLIERVLPQRSKVLDVTRRLEDLGPSEDLILLEERMKDAKRIRNWALLPMIPLTLAAPVLFIIGTDLLTSLILPGAMLAIGPPSIVVVIGTVRNRRRDHAEAVARDERRFELRSERKGILRDLDVRDLDELEERITMQRSWTEEYARANGIPKSALEPPG